jgi:hypothetical protein
LKGRRRVALRPVRRKWPYTAAAALAALAVWWLWPVAEPPPPAPPETPRTAPAVLAAAPIRLSRRPPPPPPPPRNALPERDALLAAVRERSSALRDCALPGGALARLPLRLHVQRSGKMKAVDFTGEPPPPRVASCVRKTAMAWSFDKVALSSDVELLVAVSFTSEP